MPCVLIQPGAMLKILDIRHYTIGKQYRQKNNWRTIIILAATLKKYQNWSSDLNTNVDITRENWTTVLLHM
jgi:hypothetical protein